MLIRSQDKKRIINLDNLTTIEVANDYSIACFDTRSNFHFYIGMYSTEEKALKVLDMIESAYEYISTELNSFTFQMPLDSEVE